MTANQFRVWVAMLLALGTIGIVLVTGHAAQSGAVLTCRDVQGVVVARYTTRTITTLDGELELSLTPGRITARCSIQ